MQAFTKTAVPEELVAQLSDFVSTHMFLHFPRERWPDLLRGIEAAAKEFGFGDAESCIHWLVSAPLNKHQVEILAGHLTVGETFFFRDARSFELLEHRILPDLIGAREKTDRRLRIWSAGCCTGEEAYSLAISVRKWVHDLDDWNVTILATDINPRFLHAAKTGVFGEWSFRSAPPGFKELYFKPAENGRWEILPSIRKMVTFSFLNLAEDVYPSLLNDTNAMDVVFCRNVMMYFDAARMQKVIHNLHRCLVDGGWLVVSANESSQTMYAQFETVHHADGTFYRRARVADQKFRETQKILLKDLKKLIAPPVPSAESYESARAMYDAGGYAETIELLGRMPPELRVMILRVRAHANQGHLDEALACCDKLVASAGKLSPVSHYLRATILHEKGALEEAVLSYTRALYLDQGYALAHFALANLSRQRGRADEARRHFRNALEALAEHPPETILDESEGITVGRLKEIISSLMEAEAADE